MDNRIRQVDDLSPQIALLTNYDSKDESHRLTTYINWMHENHIKWYQPDLETYRDYLLKAYDGRDGSTLSSTSVKAHLSTIRSRYRSILRNNNIRDFFFSKTPNELPPSDRKAMVDEIYERMRNAIDPENAPVTVITKQDVYDEAHIRLNPTQVQELLRQVDTNRLIGIRDFAILALLLCTGIREAELCALEIDDLNKTLAGETALHVRRGKGSKERLIPYGDLLWGYTATKRWLEAAGIQSGAVFRGFYRGGKRIRPTPLTVRAINQILDKYPILLDGELRKVAPHDLRRTYARQLYESGMDILAIRDNLGHADSRTTLKYIGTMDVKARKPGQIYAQRDLD